VVETIAAIPIFLALVLVAVATRERHSKLGDLGIAEFTKDETRGARNQEFGVLISISVIQGNTVKFSTLPPNEIKRLRNLEVRSVFQKLQQYPHFSDNLRIKDAS
jgi:hypothetical protein